MTGLCLCTPDSHTVSSAFTGTCWAGGMFLHSAVSVMEDRAVDASMPGM